MNIKRFAISAAAVLLIGISLTFFAFHNFKPIKIDAVAVNDIAQLITEKWESLNNSQLPGLQYGLDYVVIDNSGKLLRATRRGLDEDIYSAINNRDTIVDIKRNDKTLGKLIIYNNTGELWNQLRNKLLVISVVILFFITLVCIAYVIYLDRSIFRPFHRMQAFARHVAAGKLDMPLEMDKDNKFGAFSESFDLMREELAKARENERIANQSKKELVASLSHDIKTPVSSIKAVCEVMMVKSANEADIRQLEVINSKADQINTLITNMFNATLEELQQLGVTITEQPSDAVCEIIRNCDYHNKAVISPIPECIIQIDMIRFFQVVDNVISNSYKYANTSINVSASIRGKYLEMEFKDYGCGVSTDEIHLLFNKFYRGENAQGKSGTGLGLYISRYLMNKMNGDMDCKNNDDGFSVILKLHLA